jgi:hypothetical protein
VSDKQHECGCHGMVGGDHILKAVEGQGFILPKSSNAVPIAFDPGLTLTFRAANCF